VLLVLSVRPCGWFDSQMAHRKLTPNTPLHNPPKATNQDTIVKSIRGTELRGDSLSTSLTREHLVVSSDFLRDDVVDAVPFLLKHAYNARMEVHEFLDAREHAVEQAHAALGTCCVCCLSSISNLTTQANTHANSRRQNPGL
jgi:hypothetical protein